LALIDFCPGDDGNGSGGLIDESRLGLGRDDDAGGEALKVESEIEFALLIWREVEDEIAQDERGPFECNAIAARGNG